MKSPIIPTVFAKSKKEFGQKFSALTRFAPQIQIDLMDGKFVPSKSISLAVIPDLRKYPNKFEVHLMVAHPEKYLARLKQKGFVKIIFHYEVLKSSGEINRLTEKVRELSMSPFLAINPETPVKEILPFLPNVDGVLLMGVHPGKEHQDFIVAVYKKISTLRKLDKKIILQLDGGVSPQNIAKLASLGLDALNAGSYVSGADDPAEAFKTLHVLFTKAKR